MASKLVVDRQKNCSMVLESERDNEERIAQKLSEYLGVPADVTKTFFHAAAAKVQATTADMVAADQAHEDELEDDDQARNSRETAATSVRETLGSLREIATAAFGEETTRRLGFDGRTPVDPVHLHRYGSKVRDSLTAWTPPERTRLEGYVFHKDAWVQQLSAPLTQLGDSFSAVDREKREGEASQVAKNRAIDESDRAYLFAASLLSAALEVVGEPQLAQRVRPPKRRPASASADDATASRTDAPRSPTEG